MNRLVRIALTLFASATIMIFLVLQRLERTKEIPAEAAADELGMVYLGMTIIGLMLTGGFTLLVVAFLRSRKHSAGHG